MFHAHGRALGTLTLLLATSAIGCSTLPPTGWETGGTQLTVPRARWINGNVLVDVDEEGRVLLNGKHVLNVDRAGRVYDAYNSPVALLKKDGYLLGTDDDGLGWVGGGEAIRPGEDHSWIVIGDDGLVLRVDDEGEQRPFGMWLGCGQAQTMQTCALVTHIIGMDLRERSGRSGPSVGIGIGVMVGP
jgi:hypothetical protein